MPTQYGLLRANLSSLCSLCCGATIVILFEGFLPIVVHLAKGESCMTGAELYRYSELFHAVRDHWFCAVATGLARTMMS